MSKVEKQLSLNCPYCFSIYQLLEIHEQKRPCSIDCQTQWEELLSRHYQDCIILNLAKKEAKKEEHD